MSVKCNPQDVFQTMTLPVGWIRDDVDHDWIEDDAFAEVAYEDQTCCVCGIYRTEVEG